MRIVAYARASTEDQQITLEDQQEKLRGYAAVYDHELVEMIVGSESAKSLDRDEIQRALLMLRNNQADGLLVLKLDRLVRDQADWQFLLKTYFGDKSKHGKHLFSVNDYIDTRSANGRMLLNFQVVIAQWEREVIAERTSAALQHKIKKGERCGRILFGYDLADDGKMLVPNVKEQAAITLMKGLRDDGWTLRSIAAELDRRGIVTKEGRAWNHSSVAGILKRVDAATKGAA